VGWECSFWSIIFLLLLFSFCEKVQKQLAKRIEREVEKEGWKKGVVLVVVVVY